MCNAEHKLWYRLRHRHLAGHKIRRQHEIDRYIVDFVCTETMLIVELDGGQHAEQVSYDERRTQHLQAMGYRVLRFWNNDVLTNIEGVFAVILESLGKAGPSPQPSPRGGEGVMRSGE